MIHEPKPTTHVVCHTCATDLHGDESDRPHEVVTNSESEAELFRLAHHDHDVQELVVA